MDIYKVLTELHAERKQVENAILLVERMVAATRGKGPGRPPKWRTRCEPPKKKRVVKAITAEQIAGRAGIRTAP
jgi:hypothetical protein